MTRPRQAATLCSGLIVMLQPATPAADAGVLSEIVCRDVDIIDNAFIWVLAEKDKAAYENRIQAI